MCAWTWMFYWHTLCQLCGSSSPTTIINNQRIVKHTGFSKSFRAWYPWGFFEDFIIHQAQWNLASRLPHFRGRKSPWNFASGDLDVRKFVATFRSEDLGLEIPAHKCGCLRSAPGRCCQFSLGTKLRTRFWSMAVRHTRQAAIFCRFESS